MAAFAEQGYRSATMRGIVAAAGVSLGLVQHHFGIKDGLRAACDERVLELVHIKTAAMEEGRISDRQVLATLMSMAPAVQRYVGRAMVDGSPAIGEMIDQVMPSSEDFLTSNWPDRFKPGSQRTRDVGAVLTALNTSTMVLQAHPARRMDLEPFTERALRRIGAATFDAYEAIADLVASTCGGNSVPPSTPNPTPARSDAMTGIIEARGLTKNYGPTTALDGLDLSVVPGEVHGSWGRTGRATPRPCASCWACCGVTPARSRSWGAARGPTPSSCTAGSRTCPAMSGCGRT